MSRSHFEKVVKVALVGDFAEVYAQEESEERLRVTGKKAHYIPLLHRLRKNDETPTFNYCFGMLQGEALDRHENKRRFVNGGCQRWEVKAWGSEVEVWGRSTLGPDLVGHQHEGGREVNDIVRATAVECVVVEALMLDLHLLSKAMSARQVSSMKQNVM